METTWSDYGAGGNGQGHQLNQLSLILILPILMMDVFILLTVRIIVLLNGEWVPRWVKL
jgi:hypothetical protein